ncbi:MAG: cytochrome c oxidase subunit II [Bacteroidia bacterium]|nr:cytochrome c oxidase subunit II [Bacteroidia bacterium]
MTLLYILGIVFFIVVMVRIMNVINLSEELSGETPDEQIARETPINAMGLLIFLGIGLILFFVTIKAYMPYMLPEAASVHGKQTDFLLDVNFIIIIAVFVLTQIALFWFVWKYKYRKGEKAYYYPHNNTIEVIWTVAPTIVLAGLLITGLKSWNEITDNQRKDGMNVQIYSKQFNFVTRYSGKDNTLGQSYFMNISDDNPLGVKKEAAAMDDKIANELHLVVNKPVMLHMNSQDVIHSMYLPHFRTQMNAVPGMTTTFYFVPTITTSEMRRKLNNPKFDYVLLCNKICGVSHYLMNMKVVVESPAEFKVWLAGQKNVFAADSTLASGSATTQPLTIN